MEKIKNKLFFILVILIGVIVTLSNYLVQFPVKYFNLENLLTYGAFTYPISFLITDLSNRKYGKKIAKKVVYFGFFCGLFATFYFSISNIDLISLRIAFGSGIAFLTAQLIDINIFDKLRRKKWFIAPLTSSIIGSIIDTLLFFSIAFYGTGINWLSLSLGDLTVKILVALIMLIPFRILLSYIKEISENKKKVNV